MFCGRMHQLLLYCGLVLLKTVSLLQKQLEGTFKYCFYLKRIIHYKHCNCFIFISKSFRLAVVIASATSLLSIMVYSHLFDVRNDTSSNSVLIVIINLKTLSNCNAFPFDLPTLYWFARYSVILNFTTCTRITSLQVYFISTVCPFLFFL